MRVAVLQGNIAQGDKWNPALRDTITDRYLSMTRQALERGATFVMWPESSTPFYFERDLIRGAAIRRLAAEGNATLLIGSDQVEPIKAVPGEPQPQRTERYYNAAFLVKPDGSIGAVYRKMHLVPFGEYVPAKRCSSSSVRSSTRYRTRSPLGPSRCSSRSAIITSAPRSATR